MHVGYLHQWLHKQKVCPRYIPGEGCEHTGDDCGWPDAWPDSCPEHPQMLPCPVEMRGEDTPYYAIPETEGEFNARMAEREHRKEGV